MAALDRSNFEECLARIARKSGRVGAQARRILQQVSDLGDTLGGAGVADPYIAAAQQLSDRVRLAAKADRLDALRNATIRAGLMQKVEAAGGIGNAYDTIRSELHGTNVGSRDSVEARWKGNAAGWQSALDWAFHQAGVSKAMVDGGMDRDVEREMWALNANEESPTRKSPAGQAAEAMVKALGHVRDRLNAAGARIGDAIDYVTHTRHDPDKMRAAAGSMRATPDDAFAAWWRDAEPKLAEKTFDDLEPHEGESDEAARRRFGRAVFDALVTGVHMRDGPAFTERGFVPGGVPYIPPAFEGTRNLARKLSEGRTLFWKDADAWHDYMQAYGAQGTLAHGVMTSLDRGARKLALMEKLGTNPAGNLNLVIRKVQEQYRPDLDGVKAFQSKIGNLQAVMAHLDGSANIPANIMAAKINATVRTWETMSDLGGVGITHFASIWPTVTAEAAHHGVPRLQMLGNLVAALVKGKGTAERQEILSQLGAYSHGLTRDMWANWQAESSVPGKLSALANLFMKYTGIHYVFDNAQAAVRETLANQLARVSGKEFGELEPHLSMMLGKYGIGADEWNALRNVPDMPQANDLRYLTPSEAHRIDDGTAMALALRRGMFGGDATAEIRMKAADRIRADLSDKLYAYYGDAAAHGTVTAGVRERAAVLGAQRPGTLGGEVLRYISQFKMWPLAAMNQVIGREIHMSTSARDAAWGLGTMLALTAAGGYVRDAIQEVASGNPVPDPRDAKVLIRALGQGGGLGILGDFLFGEINRGNYGAGLIGTAGGPAVSDADTLIKLYDGWLHGKAGWPDIAHFAVKHVPFANLVYLKGALDYMAWFHMYEAANPGWWERTNRRLMSEGKQPMMGYKPGQGVPWTPWGIGGGG